MALPQLLEPGFRQEDFDRLKTAQLMRSDLAKIGVKLKIVQQAWPVIETRLAHGQYDSLLSGWIADNASDWFYYDPIAGVMEVRRLR